jgi:hypothetical protein
VSESFVIGGTRFADGTNEGDFQQWRLTTTVPNQQYLLNTLPTGLVHEVRVIDFPAWRCRLPVPDSRFPIR